MRIGLVVTGGVDRSGRHHVIPSLLWMIERLARHHEVFVYALRYHASPCSYPLLGATVRDLGRPMGILRQSRALHRALRDDGPFDALHAYWALPAGLAACLAGRCLRIPVLVTCDSGEFSAVPEADYGLQRRWRQRLAVATVRRLARHITVCSHYQALRARACRVDQPIVVPIGVPIERFTPVTTPEGPPWRLIHVANLNRIKDQTTLLEGLARVVALEPRVHLDIVGLDTLGGAVQRLARDLDVAGHITFHGVLTTDEIIPLYQRAHVAILTSRHEAAGVVTLEAAACGIPTVGTRVGYVHDWAPAAAVAVPVGDAAALTRAVVDVLRTPERRRSLAREARARALAHDADWTTRTFAALYADVAR